VSDLVTSVLSGVLIVAIIFVLVRPGSDAGTAVKDVSGALGDIVKSAVR